MAPSLKLRRSYRRLRERGSREKAEAWVEWVKQVPTGCPECPLAESAKRE